MYNVHKGLKKKKKKLRINPNFIEAIIYTRLRKVEKAKEGLFYTLCFFSNLYHYKNTDDILIVRRDHFWKIISLLRIQRVILAIAAQLKAQLKARQLFVR